MYIYDPRVSLTGFITVMSWAKYGVWEENPFGVCPKYSQTQLSGTSHGLYL